MSNARRGALPNWPALGNGHITMLLFRWAVLLLLLAAIVSFVFFIGTGQERYKLWGLKVLKWTVLAALGFFAVLILERLA
ncbi:MAG: hypothetical protein COW39_13750 [Comamonadaceae bacterium CG17_big_fil_post_rev_8_21_14_2_50_60_13]|nr:MAG: hypothetical protein COW39_13750 [Comamonadaceae bacterium CG17_big_fil_post_rev_8_21_14_2_50_60_13]